MRSVRSHTRLPLIVLIGGLIGCIGGYSLQYWVSVIAYPVNVGGKPLAQLAGVHPGHLRVHDPRARRCRACSACSR